MYYPFSRVGRFIFLLLSILFSYCNTKHEKIVSFDLKEKIFLPLPDEVKNDVITYPKIIKFIDNGKEIIVNFYQKNSLYFYDLQKKSIIGKINFPFTFNLDNFEYINNDSILLFLSGVNYFYYDTAIVVINRLGDIKHAFALIHNQIISSFAFNLKDLNDEKYFNALFPLFTSNGLYKNKVFFVINVSHEKFINEPFIPILGYFNFENCKTIVDTSKTYPFKNKIKTFNFSQNVLKLNFTVENKNDMFINFNYSPVVYKVDLETNSIKPLYLNSKLIDTTNVYNENYYGKKITYFYSYVHFCEPFKKYIRFTAKMKDNVWYRSIVTYDTNFKYLGECFFSKPLSYRKGKAYYYYIDNDSLIIEEYIPEEIPYKNAEFENELKSIMNKDVIYSNEACYINSRTTGRKKNVYDFLKNRKISFDSTCSILILHENGCGPCNEYFINFIKNNLFLLNMKDKPFKFVYITNDTNKTKKIFKQEKIEPVILDKPQNYNSYHFFNIFNPRLVLIKNNKIISDTIYMPNQLEILIDRLLQFYGFEAEKQK